jgi:hypothetical protein
MIDTAKPVTAKAKLALSRAELLAAMGYEELKGEASGAAAQVVQISKPESSSAVSHLGAKVSHSVVGSWWRRSRLSSVVEISEPFLEDYARKHPGKLVAYGAGTGALLWILKPWRLLSVATVVGLLLKSSDITGMVADMASKARRPAAETFPPLPGSERSPRTAQN